MTSDIEPVVRQVVADLLPDAGVAFATDGGLTVTVTEGDELVCAVYADADAPVAEIALHVANVVQASAVERLGRAVPACPGHAHAAVMRTTGTGVAWTCPVTGDVVTAYAVADGPVAH